MEESYFALPASPSKRRYLRANLSPFDPERCERELRLAALVRRASWVEEEQLAVVFEEGDVRVSEDDNAGLGEAPLHPIPSSALRAGVVNHRNTDASEVELPRFRQPRVRRVEVSPDGKRWRIAFQFVEEGRIHEVSGVEDEVGAFEMGKQRLWQSLRPAGDMGVGDDDGDRTQSSFAVSHSSRKYNSALPIKPCPSSGRGSNLKGPEAHSADETFG